MIVLIRIGGQIKLDGQIKETLNRMNLRKKYSCVLLDDKIETRGMIEKSKNCIAYGVIDEKTLIELIEKRARGIYGKKPAIKEVLEAIKSGKFSGNWEKYNMKPFFGLHPPRGGIKSKEHFPKGVLGNNKEKINDLIRRML